MRFLLRQSTPLALVGSPKSLKIDGKFQKNAKKIWSCQKKVVILQPFCVCSARGRVKTYL